jgi:hypothetical protein
MPTPLKTFLEKKKTKEKKSTTYAPEKGKGDLYTDNDDYRRKAEQNATDKVVREARWSSLKEEFLELSIKGEFIHWPSLSAKYGFAYQTVRNKSSKDKWGAEIEQRRKAREDFFDSAITARHLEVTKRVHENFSTSEEAIRTRHAEWARAMQEKAFTGLTLRKLEEFKPHELIRLLELGITEERRAMGMKETADLPAPPEEGETIRQGYKSVFEQLGGHHKAQQIGTLLLKELTRTGGKIIMDVDGKEVDEAKPVTGKPVSVYEPVPEAKVKPKIKINVGPKAAA